MSAVRAHPLCWPPHIDRAKWREAGKFRTSLSAALANVEDSLRRFAADSGKKIEGLVISSNFSLGDRRPADPGVAVWFIWDGMQICIPVDRYTTVEANLQAIHHVIEARRTELRHGTLALVRATFQGFRALPAPAGESNRSWREILGFHDIQLPSKSAIDHAWREKARAAHPDAGGSNDAMAELNRARADALAELSKGAA